MRVCDIMSSPVETISGANHNLQDAAVLMMRKKIGSLIVINSDDNTSIITERDIVRAVADGNLEAPITDYMAYPLITINENAHLDDAAALMLGKHIRRLPVVDDQGRLSGIVNMRDITERIQEQLLELLNTDSESVS